MIYLAAISVFMGPTAMQRDAQFQQAIAGMRTTVFHIKEGTVRLYLPEDIRPGDTISGTVIADPVGKTESEILKNGSVLEGIVVEVDGKSAGSGKPRFQVPNLPSMAALPILLKSSSGKVLSRASVPVFSEWPAPLQESSLGPEDFAVPPMAQSGNVLPIAGSFDGVSANTSFQLGSQNCPIFAESPRISLPLMPRTALGAQKFELKEGSTLLAGQLPCVKVTHSTPTTVLKKGERSSIRATVSGLESVPLSNYPIPFQFTNLTPTTIELSGGATVHRVMIHPSSVRAGTWSTEVDILGLIEGGFQVQGIVLFDFSDDTKAKLPARAVNAWIRQIVANFEQEIRDKEKDPEKKTRVELLRKVVSNLKKVSVTDNNAIERQATLRAVDVQLNLITMLDIGCSLIGVAADMLGYTDLPMPSILDLLKGIKALNVLSNSGMIDKAIDLGEAYQKANDAKQKAEQLAKLKKALQELQDSARKQAAK